MNSQDYREDGSIGASSALTDVPKCSLKVVAVCESQEGCDWLARVWEHLRQLIGADAGQAVLWDFGALQHPEHLEHAIVAAAGADVLIVSTFARSTPSRELCAWVEGWRERRAPKDGLLVALVTLPQWPGSVSEQVQEYLRKAAWEARLDFLLQEQRSAVAVTGDEVPSGR